MYIVLNGELGCFYLFLLGIAVLHRVYNNLQKIPTLTLEEEEEPRPSHQQGRMGESRALVQGNDFFIVPTVRKKCQGSIIRILSSSPQMEFSVMWDGATYNGAKSSAITIMVSRQGGAYTKALKMKNP